MVMAEYEWQTSNMIKEQFEVNILGPINLTAMLLPAFRKDKSYDFIVHFFILYLFQLTR